MTDKVTENQEQKQEVVIPKEVTVLEKIQLLANLANSVQDPALKTAFMALPSGEQLYHIFVGAVSKEIESMMNPSKAAPKELMDTLAVTNSLKTQVVHMYNAMAELSRAPIIGVLSVLNTSIGGRPIPTPQNEQQAPQMQPQEQAPARQQRQMQQPTATADENNSVRTVRRGNDTGMTW